MSLADTFQVGVVRQQPANWWNWMYSDPSWTMLSEIAPGQMGVQHPLATRTSPIRVGNGVGPYLAAWVSPFSGTTVANAYGQPFDAWYLGKTPPSLYPPNHGPQTAISVPLGQRVASAPRAAYSPWRQLAQETADNMAIAGVCRDQR